MGSVQATCRPALFQVAALERPQTVLSVGSQSPFRGQLWLGPRNQEVVWAGPSVSGHTRCWRGWSPDSWGGGWRGQVVLGQSLSPEKQGSGAP